MMNTYASAADKLEACRRATLHAKEVLKVGDRLSVKRCPNTWRTVTFAGWDGNWIVTASEISDVAAINIRSVNGIAVNFANEDWTNTKG